MKKSYLCIVLLFLLVSCSSDEDISKNEYAHTSKKDVSPQNQKNPLDEKGKQYYDLLALYLKTNKIPNSINEITHQIHFISNDFTGSNLMNKRSTSLTDEDVVLIMNNPQTKLIEIVEASSLGMEAKSDLLIFVQTLIERQGDNYEDVYTYITSFEANVHQSTTINEEDSDLILTLSSIARYALFMEWSRKDRDWETSVGNRGTPFFEINEESIISLLAILDQLI